MTDAQAALDSAIQEVTRVFTSLKRNAARRVQSRDECDTIRATTLAWFNRHRPVIIQIIAESALRQGDTYYQYLLSASERSTLRSEYLANLKSLKAELVELRSEQVVRLAGGKPSASTPDDPPDFSRLVSDTKLQKLLVNRWNECRICIKFQAPLAATVMMGGLLEGLLLARVKQEADQKKIFTAVSAPKDKSSITLKLNDWMLNDYISVAHELKWISQSAKDVGGVLRDYRNYIHPHKEFRHGIEVTNDDTPILWEVSKSIARQILR